ncbi:MAG: helix-turn-helix transcriptional regulator [Deltaproteobacteria bacterium]|nr:helix-turn-helix transcriptional regulator [Deltaproteobacteria bacterium]
MERGKRKRHPSEGRQERYIQPSLLLGLCSGSSYGYELIKKIKDLGFIQGPVPPGMIYRHLRQLEDDGLVSSRWDTKGTGPAKRIYHLTEAGTEMLALWVDFMEEQKNCLNAFLERYEQLIR